MKTLKALVACLFAGLVVMGFVGCSQPAPNTYIYEGTANMSDSEFLLDGNAIVTVAASDDGTWIHAFEVSGEKHDLIKATFEGSLTTDGELKVIVTHIADIAGKSFEMKPVEPYEVSGTFMADNGKKMILKKYFHDASDLVLTRK